MLGFLQWLYDRSWKVIDWFVNRFTPAITLLANFWDWVNARAVFYYNKAMVWALPLIEGARTWAANLHNVAIAWATDRYNVARAWITDRYNAARAWAADLFNVAKDWTINRYNAAIAWTTDRYNAATAWASTRIETARTSLMAWARDAVNLVPFVEDIRRVFSGTRLSRVITLTTAWWDTLEVLLNNPLGFIVAYLKNVFVTLLCYSLAYGLGTTKLKLPPWPIFGPGGEVSPEE